MKKLLNRYFSQTTIKLLFKSIPETNIFFILLSSKNPRIISTVKQCLCLRLFQGRQYVCEKSGKYKKSTPFGFSLVSHNSNVSTQLSTCSKQ